MLYFTKSLCLVLTGVWLTLFVANEARADTVIFSNFGPGMTFNAGQALSVQGSNIFGGQIPALAFTPSVTLSFSSAQLAIGTVSGPNILQVVLMTSSGGLPGNVIESTTLTNVVPPFGSGGIVTANSVLHPVLSSGTQYWLVAFPSDPNTSMGWNYSFNDFSTPAVRSFSSLTGPWFPILGPEVPRPAFQINGVPEPTTMMLLGSGLAALGVAVRKRRKDERNEKE